MLVGDGEMRVDRACCAPEVDLVRCCFPDEPVTDHAVGVPLPERPIDQRRHPLPPLRGHHCPLDEVDMMDYAVLGRRRRRCEVHVITGCHQQWCSFANAVGQGSA